jgi:hypothetical protein
MTGVRGVSGIDSADIMINRVFKNQEFKVRGKYDDHVEVETKFGVRTKIYPHPLIGPGGK